MSTYVIAAGERFDTSKRGYVKRDVAARLNTIGFIAVILTFELGRSPFGNYSFGEMNWFLTDPEWIGVILKFAIAMQVYVKVGLIFMCVVFCILCYYYPDGSLGINVHISLYLLTIALRIFVQILLDCGAYFNAFISYERLTECGGTSIHFPSECYSPVLYIVLQLIPLTTMIAYFAYYSITSWVHAAHEEQRMLGSTSILPVRYTFKRR